MPTSRNGARAPSAIFVKTRADRESPKGRTLYCHARPSNANRRTVCVVEGSKHESKHPSGQVKSSHLYLYSAFNNTNCDKATAQYQNGKIVSIM